MGYSGVKPRAAREIKAREIQDGKRGQISERRWGNGPAAE